MGLKISLKKLKTMSTFSKDLKRPLLYQKELWNFGDIGHLSYKRGDPYKLPSCQDPMAYNAIYNQPLLNAVDAISFT